MGKNKFNKNFKNKPDNYKPAGKQEDLDRPIEELQLSEHCYNALKAGGVVKVYDLCVQRMSRMYRIQNIGKKDCLEIKAKLKQYNLDFRPEDEENKPQQNNQGGQNKQNQPQKPQQNQNKQNANNANKQNNGNNNKQNNNNHQQNNQNNQNNQNKQKLRFSIFDDRELVEFLEGRREREVFKWEEPEPTKLEVFKFCRNGKWGYKNQKGATIIQPAYDEAFQFSEGLACVEKDSKLGYIDLEGNLVIDFQYDTANSFSEGLACVTKDDKTGYIDNTGKYVYELKFEKATPFVNGKAMIKQDGKWGVLSKDGSIYWR